MKKLLLFLTIVSILLTGCINLKEPTISLLKSDIKLLNYKEAEASFKFSIINDNYVPLNGKIDYAVFINNKEFLKGLSSEVNVGSNSSSEFTLSAQIELLKLFDSLNTLLQMVTQGEKSIPVEFQGIFKTQVGIFPLEKAFSSKGDIPLPSLEQILTKK